MQWFRSKSYTTQITYIINTTFIPSSNLKANKSNNVKKKKQDKFVFGLYLFFVKKFSFLFEMFQYSIDGHTKWYIFENVTCDSAVQKQL